MNIKEIIVNFLRDGLTQKQISYELQEMDIKPNSLSSVEKHLKALRKEYRAETLFHLACLMIKNEDLELNESQNEE